MARIIWNGEPGTVWTNETGKVQYQMQVQFANSCGVCIQYAGSVGPYWPIPFHRSCRCRNIPIWPGQTSAPFVDFWQEIQALPAQQQAVAVGASNFRLLEAGVVKWEDVVTKTRVRDLREVVSREKLSIERMTNAGVRPRLAKAAFDAVNTPAHVVSDQVRRELVQKLEEASLSHRQIARAVGNRLAARVGVTPPRREPPAAPAPVPVGPKHPAPETGVTKPEPLAAKSQPAFLRRIFDRLGIAAAKAFKVLGIKNS